MYHCFSLVVVTLKGENMALATYYYFVLLEKGNGSEVKEVVKGRSTGGNQR